MPDILKVTTPLIHKNQPVPPKSNVDPTNPFQLQDTARVIQPHNQSEILKQNTSLLEGGDAPTLLLNLLKDPAVAVSYLKNIFLLEEIFKLLPANNKTVTQEIEQYFHRLLMQSDDILPEMLRQENASTLFKGELFDFLRQTSDEHASNPDLQLAIANLLKAVNNQLCKKDILDAVANSLDYLRDSLASSKSLSAQLESLSVRFREPGAENAFQQLKAETLGLFQQIEDSLLFSPKLAKVLSITVYNLSRFNDSQTFLSESAFRLRQLLTGPQRQQFAPLFERFQSELRAGLWTERPRGGDDAQTGGSRVMDALIGLVARQSGDQNLNTADAAKIDNILHSLLSSPCNFTPLLHFIVPALHENMRAFAEIWINPESDEKDMPEGAGKGIHFLLVVDVESIGRFEAELFVHGQIIDFSLFCPEDCTERYEEMMRGLPGLLAGMSFRLGQTRLEPLKRSRSLMDVFKSLPYKRVGVDVKI